MKTINYPYEGAHHIKQDACETHVHAKGSLSLGSIWTGKYIDFYMKMNDLNRGDRANSQNLSLSLGSI